MVQGKIHSDASIFPFPSAKAGGGSGNGSIASSASSRPAASATTREALLQNAANFIQARKDPDTGSFLYTNTFILSSWIPVLGEAGGRDLPRLVTYGSKEGSEDDPSSKPSSSVVGSVYNEWNHPALSPGTCRHAPLLRARGGTTHGPGGSICRPAWSWWCSACWC